MPRKSAKKIPSPEVAPHGENDPMLIFKIASEIIAKVPAEEIDKLPRDLSVNLDHYLYGAPKEK